MIIYFCFWDIIFLFSDIYIIEEQINSADVMRTCALPQSARRLLTVVKLKSFLAIYLYLLIAVCCLHGIGSASGLVRLKQILGLHGFGSQITYELELGQCSTITGLFVFSPNFWTVKTSSS